MSEAYRGPVIRIGGSALDDVTAELDRQVQLWGVQDHEPATWLAILTEEAGEVAKEIADGATDVRAFNPVKYRTELVQVAAVAVAAVEALDRKASLSTANLRREWEHEHVGEPMPDSLRNTGIDDAHSA